jgi:hypothetical protein
MMIANNSSPRSPFFHLSSLLLPSASPSPSFIATHVHTHTTFMQQTTKERLNKQGNSTSFKLHDRVKIYVPPMHAQLLRTGRLSNHIGAWRGPCRIAKVLSPVTYEMIEECSNRTFQRTLVNIRPFRASLPHLITTCSRTPRSIPEPLSLFAAQTTPPLPSTSLPSPKPQKPMPPSPTLGPPTPTYAMLSSNSYGSTPKTTPPSLNALARPATTNKSLARSQQRTYWTFSLPPTLPSPTQAVLLHHPTRSCTTSATSYSFTNNVSNLPSPNALPTSRHHQWRRSLFCFLSKPSQLSLSSVNSVLLIFYFLIHQWSTSRGDITALPSLRIL